MKKEVNCIEILRKKRGQIWVETMIYTLIAFGLIGLILAFAGPKIEEIQDREIIERSMNTLEEINLIINTIGSPGNQRVIELKISKGSLSFDGENDTIYFEIESRHAYSEPGEDVPVGDITVNTEEVGRLNDVTLTLEYEDRYNITFDSEEKLGSVRQSPTPHKILISNKGEDELNRTIIDIGETS